MIKAFPFPAPMSETYITPRAMVDKAPKSRYF